MFCSLKKIHFLVKHRTLSVWNSNITLNSKKEHEFIFKELFTILFTVRLDFLLSTEWDLKRQSDPHIFYACAFNMAVRWVDSWLLDKVS